MKLTPLLAFLLCFGANASEWVVEFKRVPTTKELAKLSKKHKIERFYDFDNDFFKRAYVVDSNEEPQQLSNLLSKVVPVAGVEAISEVDSFSIRPSQEQSRLKSDDLLFPYQWGLVSQGQKVRRDKDDINFVMIEDPANLKQQGPDILSLLGDRVNDLPPEVLAQLILAQPKNTNSASDVNFVGFLDAIKGRDNAKEIKVAVLDSGIDLGHPELKNVISKNLNECKEDGSTDYETREDRDDNGVPGDCLGWNFTVHKNDPRAKLPMDDSGHGTHVAGILAAESNNATGVAGFGSNIKIVPIKVLHEDESSEEAKQIALTDRIGRGILYAIKRNVDVINLSLGWLRQSDTKYLREAVNAALARGIPVVAAAGNNGSNARLYPCSYPGVICVGATRIDGKVAGFSNHGGNVDVFAPGDTILSTWPVSLVPMDFSVHGYEIQSGTSQATPFVSGTIAQLKAQIPGIKLNEIQARILLSANNDIKEKDSALGISGRLDMAKALLVSPAPAIVPIFKSLDEISYTLKDRKFRVPLPIVNYWVDSEEIKVSFKVLSDAIELTRSEFTIAGLKEEKGVTLPIEGLIRDLNADRAVKLVVTIEHAGKSVDYTHTVNFVRLLIDDPEVEERTVKFVDKTKPLATIQNNTLIPLVSTSESFYGTAAPEWFLRRNSEKGIELTFFSAKEEQIVEGETIALDGSKRLLGLINVDFDNDGKDDRLLRTTRVDAEGNEDALMYSFRNTNGAPLFGETLSDWKFSPDVAVANDTLAFVSTTIENTRLPTPIFVTEGALPEHQQPTGFFDTRDEATRKRIYLLVPSKNDEGRVELKTFALDTQKNIEKWRNELGLRWNDPIKVSTILAPSLEEHKQGIARVLISAGHASRRTDAIIEIKGLNDYLIKKIRLNGIRPEGQDAIRVAQIDNNRFARHERTGFIGFYDGKRARTSVIADQVATQSYVLKDEFDGYSGHIASFIRGEELTSVYTTQNRLVLVQDNGQEQKVLERPLERFDFLPGQVFNELFWPIARMNSAGDLFPSLYVDASSIHSNSVHVIEAREEGFVAPMGQSVLLPPNCKGLNPVVLPGEKAHRTTMICLEKDRGFVFKFVK